MDMSNQEPENFSAASRLSAEAEVFIPMSPEQGSNGTAPTGELPAYMTNCYPFVQGDPIQNGNRQRWPNAQTQGARMPGQRGRGRHGSRGNQYHGYTPRQPVSNYQPQYGNQPYVNPQYSASATFQPVVDTQYPYFQGVPAAPAVGGVAAVWGSPGVYDGGMMASLGQGVAFPVVDGSDGRSGGSDRSHSSSQKSGRGGRRNRKFDNPGKVSVGVQNEAGLLGVNGGKKKARTKTIILMDVAIQTDFNDEIANLTLADRPNSLYQKSKARTRRKAQNVSHNASTDSEDEVDSDSGYSSPLHRRNLTSCGTHPVNSYLNSVPSSDTNMYLKAAPPVGANPYHNLQIGDKCLDIPILVTPSVNNVNCVHPVMMTPSNPVRSYASIAKTAPPSQKDQKQPEVPKESVEAEDSKPKRKRKRNRKRKNKLEGAEDPTPGANNAALAAHTGFDNLRTESAPLHFEDESEFPGLSSSAPGAVAMAQSTSYSDILKVKGQHGGRSLPVKSGAESCDTVMNATVDGEGPLDKTNQLSAKENKIARKRRKRREIANEAAEKELMEISLEQQVLKEIGLKATKPTQPQPSGKKSKQPIALNIAEMISALENSKQKKEEPAKPEVAVATAKKRNETYDGPVLNVLDSSAPALKRGKERENPKSKKSSTLKKVILKEREERKKFRLIDDPGESNPEYTGLSVGLELSEEVAHVDYGLTCMVVPYDSSQDYGLSSKTSDMFTPASAELSPISQSSPISMSPLSPGSPVSSGVNSPVAGCVSLNKSPAALKLHSRRFREYCNQILNKEIDNCCTLLLQDLVRFQDRLYHKDPIKAKSKRRIVLGLREVGKHLKLKKIKVVIISPNLERIQSKGGLDDALYNIIQLCSEQNVPFVFALGRRALGRACAKLVPVSVAGVFNYEGSEENFKRLMDLTEQARAAYNEMVCEIEAEMTAEMAKSGNQQIYAHMGHSRTPSGCSVISFASSLLSEPISQNEDLRKDEKSANLLSPKDGTPEHFRRTYLSHSRNSSLGKVSIVESIDEGNEADTEDLNEAMLQSMNLIIDKVSDKLSCVKEDGGVVEDSRSGAENDDDNDTVEELPHIDSIHNLAGLELNAELLSQHSGTNAEVLSTHSSKTLGANTPMNGNATPVDHHSDAEVAPVTLSQRIKSLDKERIESWVEEAKTCIQDLKISEDEGDCTPCIDEPDDCL